MSDGRLFRFIAGFIIGDFERRPSCGVAAVDEVVVLVAVLSSCGSCFAVSSLSMSGSSMSGSILSVLSMAGSSLSFWGRGAMVFMNNDLNVCRQRRCAQTNSTKTVATQQSTRSM